MNFFIKSAGLALIFTGFFQASGKWTGYMPFDGELSLSGDRWEGNFFIPVPAEKKNVKTGKTTRYTKFIVMGHDAVSMDNPCDADMIFENFKGIVSVGDTDVAKKNFNLLRKWCPQDQSNGMLFRPYVFYDVMGTMEWDFQGQPKKRIDKPDWTDARKKSGILTAIYKANGDASQLKETNFAEELKHYPGRRSLLGSKFEVKQIGQLREDIKTAKKSSAPGSFAMLDGYKIGRRIPASDDTYPAGNQSDMLAALRQTDIRYLMEKHPGAVFQLASTANCLEGGMYTRRLEQMQEHPAQGEEASLATMGGAIVRKYGLKYQPSLFGGLKDAEIVKLGNTDFSAPAKVLRAAAPTDVAIVAVGVHRDVPVTSGYASPLSKSLSAVSNLDETNERVRFLGDNYLVAKYSATESRDPLMVFNKFIEYDDRKPVDLILTSAFDIKRGGFNITDKIVKESARVVLKAAYLGAILATAWLGKKELYLTLVGTGAFGNPFDFVIDAFKVDGKLDPEILGLVRDFGIKATFIVYPDLKSGRGTRPSEVAKLNTLIADLNSAINATQPDAGTPGPIASVGNSGELELAQALFQLAE